ncbi:exonuclease domain-containing protein [Aurantimonas sp. E1-2-R+4]|uniref:exonuclease domain-containing protein n=1 Tax=Aurantimonas sp. E1-2-R+4 TaxID=3113714 RepID=UPI002F942088
MDYFVLDLETANPDYSSICQIGLIEVREGDVIASDSFLIDPKDFFDPFNTSIHGITPAHVREAPSLTEIYDDLSRRLRDQIVLHHGPFDRVAMMRAAERHDLPPIPAQWLDNQAVVRRAWPDFARSGYGLRNLCRHFELTFSHHDALEDARVTEIIFRRAVSETGIEPGDWLARARQPRTRGRKSHAERQGISDGIFYGQTIVFTGQLGAPRAKAEEIANALGFTTAAAVTKKAAILVVGLQDRDKLAGYEKSSKQRKAEILRDTGHEIDIISEADFWALVPDSLRPPTKSKKAAPSRRHPSSISVELSLETLFSDEELAEMFGFSEEESD